LYPDFQRAHRHRVSEAPIQEMPGRDDGWSEAIVVGGSAFVHKMKSEVGLKALHRELAF